ncbi:MAG TPA: acetyl-CoA carboxylase biotin carboxyl carrier protein subunit [Acetobacteraceae bacterium]|jgi:acetyl-CoA carboxylase biotin carboxyl carrier protein|nr:acetyl-CoA carboxylase biotin carboxyl carrier protein subunit [Acetobacteraceae bacterium]
MSRIPFDADAIRALAAILTETGLTEIELAERDSRIRVVRAVPVAGVAPPPAATPAVVPVVPVAPLSAAARAAEDAHHPGAVTSPMVGVAYLSPEPGAPVFVSVGQAVTAGQTLLLIEAMKTFNQIRAPKAGTVTRILVSSGAPVEYGEALMILE